MDEILAESKVIYSESTGSSESNGKIKKASSSINFTASNDVPSSNPKLYSMDLGVTLSPGLIVKNSPTGLIQPPNNFILEESLSKLGDGASDSPKQAAYIFLER